MDTSLSERKFEILYGPNRDLLFDACKYAFCGRVVIPIDFSVATGYTAPPNKSGSAYIPAKFKTICLESITHESDTGYVFCLKGTCEADIHPGDWNHLQYKGYAFEAHYDTQSRKGTIQFFSSI